MIGDNIKDQAHVMAFQLREQQLELSMASQFRIEPGRVNDVVSVGTALAGREYRRGVDVGDAQIAQVGDQVPRIGEAEARVELEPIGSGRDPQWMLLMA
jgi:hypothetical protein